MGYPLLKLKTTCTRFSIFRCWKRNFQPKFTKNWVERETKKTGRVGNQRKYSNYLPYSACTHVKKIEKYGEKRRRWV